MRHPIKRDDMVKALEDKGFVCDQSDRDHDYYYFVYKGKQTKAKTKISRGTGYREYDDGLFRLMCRPLGLDYTKDVRDLLLCPLTREDYIKNLKAKRILIE